MSRRGARAFGRAVGLAGVMLASGCATTSIASDVRRVRELTGVAQLPRLALGDVDAEPDADAMDLLARPIDADAAVRVALLNDRGLRATLRELGVARGRMVDAGRLPNPVAEVELLPERNTAIEFRVEYDLTTAVLAPLRARAAEAELEAERFRAAGAVVELGYRVRVAFYALAAAEQRLEVATRMLDALAAAREAALALSSAGSTPALDLALRETAFERGRIVLSRLELERAEARERIARLLGVHGAAVGWHVGEALVAAPDTFELPDTLEVQVLEASLELGEVRHRVDALARRANLTRTEGLLPDISIDLHALRGAPDDATGARTSTGYGGGVSVGIPLFSRRQGATAATRAELDALTERYHGLAIDLRSRAREARANVVSAHARARRFDDVVVPAQRRVSEQTLLQYNAMQVGVFDLLDAKREELAVELDRIDARREYWSAVAAVDALRAGWSVSADGAPARLASTNSQETRQGGH